MAQRVEEDHEEGHRVLAGVDQVAHGLGAAVPEAAQALGEPEPGGQAAHEGHH